MRQNMFGKFICSAALAACLAAPALAESTSQPLIFAAGTTGTAASGQVSGQDTADFTLEAEAGQLLTVKMNTDNPSSYFNIYAPGSTPGESQALFIGSTAGLTAELTLPASGTYLIRTYLMPGAGREGESARFSLTVDVTGRKPQSTDMTNALNSATPVSGPQFWQVTGITGALNIRTDPSTSAAVAGSVTAGAVLRNGGCETVGERSWCKIESTSGSAVSGWAAQDFLTETSAPTASGMAGESPASTDPTPTDAAVAAALAPASPPPAATSSAPASPAISPAKPAPKPKRQDEATPRGSASGTLPCSTALGVPTRDCGFSVTRSGTTATVTVNWPEGGHREIRFDNGNPVAQGRFTSERRGDLTVINIDNERYEVPDAVINGG